MAERACVKRLQKEYRALCKEPVPHILARPNPNDILEWHYVLEGSEGTPFAGGIYYGKVKFPSDYPFKPPGISMITPNGRFATQKRICMSMSDFHPETWNPMWSVSSILTGLLSFMMDNSPTTGSVSTTVAEKQRLARASLAFNCKSPMFRKMFPEFVEQYNQLQTAEKLNSDRLAEKEQPHAASAVEGKEKEDDGVLDKRNRRHTSKIPFWLLFFIFSVLCAIMALPLLLI
ncbi:Ubiquitin-conjugating enzyme E2 34 [Nymphaea thermarum]|nr:Ubiquitin-conjugating enzyme E2 34 [Nymphaea thermarum]